MNRLLASLLVLAATALPPRAGAEPPAAPAADAEAEQKALEAQIAKELGQGSSAPVPEPAPSAPAPAPASAAPSGQNPYARLLALPDLSAIGSFAGLWNDYDVETRSPRSGPSAPRGAVTFKLQEVELGLQSVVDPYARADVFIGFGPDGADVEEAYLTTLSLPGSLQVKAGRFFTPFGRINAQHPHTWDFVDGPLAHDRLLADDALAGPGVDLSWLAPLPWFAELHAAVQTTAPTAAEPGRLTGVARLAQFFPLGDETTLGAGLSAGLRDEGDAVRRELYGADLLVRWRPAASRASVTLQGELYGRRYSDVAGAPDWGGYGQLFWRVGEHGGVGLRYDQAPVLAGGTERRYGAVATWYLTEFQRYRIQLSEDVRPGGAMGVEAILQAEFAIGAHGAHPF